MILKGYILGIGYALLCLILSFVLYKLGIDKKYTRKAVHILVGFEWVILYHFMGAGLHFLIVCVLFLILLSIAYRGRFMPMISSDEDNAPGTVYYAAAMTGVAFVGCFVPEVMLPFGIGVMCTSVGDGLAGIVGQSIKRFNPTIYSNKTALGSLTNFVASSLSAWAISFAFSMELGIWTCLGIGLLSMELELITPFGFDNISVTWGTTAFAFSCMYFSAISNYLIPILLTPVIIIFVVSKRALTTGGTFAAVLLDIFVSLAFGNRGFVILCCFFIGAIIVDKIKKAMKKRGSTENENEDCRNYIQVIANGMVAFVSSVAFLISGKIIFIVPFVTSLAEAFSDTVASGIGSFATKTYDPFRRAKCENGLSGGMSVEGTFAALLGALLIPFIAYIIGTSGFGIKELFIAFGCAFFGSVFDSFLGSVFQIKYRCVICGAITEQTYHCQSKAERYSGFESIDNDIVNIISCTVSAVLATVIAFLV